MKTTFFTLTLLLGMSLGSFAKTENRTVYMQTEKYEVDKTHPSITLPTNFGKPFIIDKSDLTKLSKNEIYQIDLIYTQYRSSESFDQEKLNQKRVHQLKKLVSTIDKDAPTWNYIEQTKAIDCETAKTYFHGFVIYYKPKPIDRNAIKSKFQPYQTQLKIYQLNNSESKEFIYSSGTKIHIPKNAVKYTDGTLVKGAYEITYCEFRTPADIAFSGIPMKFEVGGVNSNFSSVGMYEIRGYQNGQELLMNKPITVNFNCTKIVNDASFYSLNDETGKWKSIKPIKKEDFGAENISATNGETQVVQVEMLLSEVINKGRLGAIRSRNISKNNIEMTMDSVSWKMYLKIRDDKDIKPLIIKESKHEKIIHVSFKDSETFKNSIWAGRYIDTDANLGIRRGGKFIDNGSRTANTMLGSGNKGHTYPTIVRGLQSSKFGVYNCDQIYRVGKTMTIHPKYVDATTEKVIDNPNIACLMDLNYNGSFSFDPNYITLNPDGKNALLLFTEKKEMYLVLPHQLNLKALDQKHPTIKMYNVTNKVKSSKDLQVLLNS